MISVVLYRLASARRRPGNPDVRQVTASVSASSNHKSVLASVITLLGGRNGLGSVRSGGWTSNDVLKNIGYNSAMLAIVRDHVVQWL